MLLFPYFKHKLTKAQRLTNPPTVLCSERRSGNLNQRVDSITLLSSTGSASLSLFQTPSLILTFTTSHLPRFVLWLVVLLFVCLLFILKWFYIHTEVANIVQTLLGTLLPVSLMSVSYIIIIWLPKPQFFYPPKYSLDNTDPFYNHNETPSDDPFTVAAPYLPSGNLRHIFRHFKSQGTSLVVRCLRLWDPTAGGSLITELDLTSHGQRSCMPH